MNRDAEETTLSLEGTRVLVTGGAGFIGSHLVDSLLSAGATVRAFDNLSTGRLENLADSSRKVDFQEGDLRDETACRRACEGIELVYHQAALGSVPRSLKDPATTVSVNVGGTANLFAAARDAGVRRVIYASSSSVYGSDPTLPKVEGREGDPLSPYALSKRMNEQLATIFGRCFSMELIGLRYFNVFGPRQDPRGPYAAVIPRFLDAYAAGIAPVIYGDGEQSRDFTYVANAVQANLLAATASCKACGRAFNVGVGETCTINRLAELIRELMSGGPEPEHQPARPGDVRSSLASLENIRSAFGYEPEFTLKDGLRETVAAYSANAEDPVAPRPLC